MTYCILDSEKWKKEVPTEKGYYWVRGDGEMKDNWPRMIYIWIGSYKEIESEEFGSDRGGPTYTKEFLEKHPDTAFIGPLHP